MKKFIYKCPKPKIRKFMINTVGELMNAVIACQTKEQAQNFIDIYSKENQYYKENIGYVIGYVEPAEKRLELYNLFDLNHPIFNTKI